MKQASFIVRFTTSAKQSLKKLPSDEQWNIAKKIEALAGEPMPRGSVKLHGMPKLYRLRSADYRIGYRINNEELIILVIKIGHRREVYKSS